jgi:hypothetical protein
MAAGSAGAYTVALDDGERPATTQAVERSLPQKPKPTQTRDQGPQLAFGGEHANRAVEVRTPDRLPKDLPESPKGSVDDLRRKESVAESTPPPAAPAPAPVAHANARSTATHDEGAGSAPQIEYKTDDAKNVKTAEDSTWARSEHGRLLEAVKGGRCQDAGVIASGIRTRAPDYYSSYVASDRGLKACMQYISDAAQKDAARAAAKAKQTDTTESR